MKQSTKDQVAGKAHEMKGAVKETVGHVTGNRELEVRGTGEKVAGKVQSKIGQVERAVEREADRNHR